MEQLVLIIHLLIAVVLVSLILMQQSEGGALGIGGGGGGAGSFLTGRGTANLMTRLTAAFAAAFFFTSIALTWLGTQGDAPRSVFDTVPPPATTQPGPGPAAPAGGAPNQGGGVLDELQSGRGLAPLPTLPNNN